jgi:hypothetical protein
MLAGRQADVKAWEEEHDHMKLLGKRCRVDYLLSMSFAGSDFIQAIPTRFDQVREFPFGGKW